MRLTPHRLKPCSLADLRPGDHIAVPRPERYTHHGIYLGQGSVAHFSDESGLLQKGRASVRETSLDAFLLGGDLFRRRHRNGWPAEVVIMRARSVLEGEIQWRPYHLIHNNCEHFATFCAARRPRSGQVRRVAGATALTTVLIAATLIRPRFRRGI